MGSTSVFVRIICSLPVGSDLPVSTITGAYVDYFQLTNDPVVAILSKTSYTGGTYADSVTTTASGTHDIYVQAYNIKNTPSIYDYVSSTIAGSSTSISEFSALIGVLLLSSN